MGFRPRDLCGINTSEQVLSSTYIVIPLSVKKLVADVENFHF